MKKWWLLFLCALGISTAWYVFYPKRGDETQAISALPHEQTPHEPKHLKETYGPYFFSVPILKFSLAQIPSLMVQVEGRDIMVELDLGLRGEASFSQEVIKNIREKTLVGERTMYGARGKSYRTSRYKAPQIHIVNLDIRGCIMEEESEEFLLDSVFLTSADTHRRKHSGRIGWELFATCNLFLDLANSRIAFCDSAETLENQGYPMQEFAKTPLHTERGFIEMLVEGSEGIQMWALDTGTTWNIVNAHDNTKTVEEMALDPSNHIELPLKIGNADFGLLSFCRIPIPLPIHVDAMLGMEFFKTHQVFIDFYEQQIYVSKPLKNAKQSVPGNIPQ